MNISIRPSPPAYETAKKRLAIIVLVVLCGVSGPFLSAALAQAAATDTLIVEISGSAFSAHNIVIDTSGQYAVVGIPSVDSLNSIAGCTRIRGCFPHPFADSALAYTAGLHRFFLFLFPDGTNIDSLATIYRTIDGIASCDINRVGHTASAMTTVLPDDPLFGNQWEHNSTIANIGTKGSGGAWALTTGSSDVVLGLLDSGIDPNHSEFSGRILTGYNVFNGSNNIADDVGHGTQVAGLAAARGDNQAGIAGVCWECKILPVKVMEPVPGIPGLGRNTAYGLALGLVWATDNGADVINFSGGWTSPNPPEMPIVEAALIYTWSRGVTPFAAAGNENLQWMGYPASSQWCVAVGAMVPDGATGERKRMSTDPLGSNGNNSTWGSNLGPDLDFVAPGEQLTTTTVGGGYSSAFYGTSAATPIAAGIACLLKSVDQSLSPQEIRWLMRASSVDIDTTGFDWSTGYGKVNARAALDLALGSPPSGFVSITNEVGGTVDYDLDPESMVRFDDRSFRSLRNSTRGRRIRSMRSKAGLRASNCRADRRRSSATGTRPLRKTTAFAKP